MTINNFVQFTANGLNVANFTEIRAALIERYKSVWGNDIDLSTGTADGEFVNETALIINNLIQALQIMYSNLDVRTANGTYLDALCALSNVVRRPATYSNASLEIENTGSSTITLTNPIFIDQAGTEWNYTGEITLTSQEVRQINVVCSEVGVIQAPAGWINSTLENLPITVTQSNPANVGSEVETDDELRARRNQSSGANGVTVLESLVGDLYNLSGIEDVEIYNNNTGAAITAKDGTSVDAHSIYVIIRKADGVVITDESIGSIIYEKLTPGIHSCDSTAAATNGIAKNYTYVVKILGAQISMSQQEVYWKQAVPIHPQIQIEITPTSYFTSEELDNVRKGLIEYLNKLQLTSDLTANAILVETMFLDPLFKGRATYTVGNITISSATNPDTYYNYKFEDSSATESGGTWTITLA